MSIDLNRLREMVLQNQRNGEVIPADPSRLIVVDKNGRIIMWVETTSAHQATIIPQETFAASGTP